MRFGSGGFTWMLGVWLIVGGATFAGEVPDFAALEDARVRIGDTEWVEIDSQHPYVGNGDVSSVVWTQTIHNEGATFIRVHFSEFTSLGADDLVIVRDVNGMVVIAYPGNEAAGRWTRSIEGDTLTVELIAAAKGGGHGVEIDVLGWGTAPLYPTNPLAGGSFFSICNTSVPSRIRAADPVASISWIDDCGGIFVCTGWLFTPYGHMITNAHCANSPTEANSLEAWFNYMDFSCDLPGEPNPDVYDDDVSFVQMDCTLDMAVFIVNDPSKGNPADVYGFLAMSSRVPASNTSLWIPQHPNAVRRQIAENCSVNDNTEIGLSACADPPSGCNNQPTSNGVITDLSFDCDIAGGSSGSPVLNTNNEVIALAHAGNNFENFGVRMSAIMPELPNVPMTIEMSGPGEVIENVPTPFTAEATFLIGVPHNVTTTSFWSISPRGAGSFDDAGVFTAAPVTQDTLVTLSTNFSDFGFTVSDVMSVIVRDMSIPTPTVLVSLTPSVDPQNLFVGQTFTVDVSLATDGDPIEDVRLIQFDTVLSSGVTVNDVEWDFEGLEPDFDALYDTNYWVDDVFSAFFVMAQPLPGFIIDLTSTPQRVVRLHVTFDGDGALSVLGDPVNPSPDFGFRVRAGFVDLFVFAEQDGNVLGEPLALAEGEGPVRIISSEPPNDAIDARQPLDAEGSPAGWWIVDISFDGDASALTESDFVVTQLGGTGEPPVVGAITPLDHSQLRLFLVPRIEPGTWTTIRHIASDTSTRLGFLPADVNGDATSNPSDILDLIDALNGVIARPTWSLDANRSGLAEPSDILTVIDLLNGAGSFDSWNGRSLPGG